MKRVKSQTLITKKSKITKNSTKNVNKAIEDTRFLTRDTRIYSEYMELPAKKTPDIKLDEGFSKLLKQLKGTKK